MTLSIFAFIAQSHRVDELRTTPMKSILNSLYFFWAVLSIPMLFMLYTLGTGQMSPHGLLHETGEFSARFLIFALMISPLQSIFKNPAWVLWLIRRRRALGLAAFAYAGLHTIMYLADKNDLAIIWAEVFTIGIWTGWLAFAIFLPLAITSNNSSQRIFGKAWKPLQRCAYGAAILTLAHWIFIHNSFGGALAHFVPLALLQTWRVRLRFAPGPQAAQ
ncbi:MAG: ferric reductase-like transmembrane domain-containing protein [Burkholderiaceae bacterium]